MQHFFSLCPCYYDNLWHIWCDIAVIASNINNILYLESDLLVLFVDRWYMMIPYTVPWLVSQVWGNMFGLNPTLPCPGIEFRGEGGADRFQGEDHRTCKKSQGWGTRMSHANFEEMDGVCRHWTALSIQKIHEVSPTGFDFCNAWTFTKKCHINSGGRTNKENARNKPLLMTLQSIEPSFSFWEEITAHFVQRLM